jgi:hypothetical protein
MFTVLSLDVLGQSNSRVAGGELCRLCGRITRWEPIAILSAANGSHAREVRALPLSLPKLAK